QVGEKGDYTSGHIPGAQFIQLADISTPRGQGLTLELPPVSTLEAAFEKLGVTDKSTIVVYFSKDWVTPTARVYFTLDYLGLGDGTWMREGGLQRGRAAEKPGTADVKEPKTGKFTPHPNANLVVDASWVSANVNRPGVAILDARAPRFYTGE